MQSHATPRSLDARLAAFLALALALGMMAPPGIAQEAKRFATPNADGTGYTINYEALAAAADMSEAEKFQVARALRNGEGHIASANVEDIAGFGGRCKIDKFLGIPDGGTCTLTADPAATKVLSKLGAFALTNAICLVVDVEDGELTEPFCDLLLEAIVSSTIEPVIDQCADRGQTTSITVGFKLVPPKITGSAKCV
jgi:hypothetical protein